MKHGDTTTTETEDSGVLSPGHHDKEASQNTLSSEQDTRSFAMYQYKDAKEQKSIAAFPLSQDISTEKGQGSLNLSTLQDTGNGHQEDCTMLPSSQEIYTKEREKSPPPSMSLDSFKAREDTGVPILSQNASRKQQNISTPSSPMHNEEMENSTGPSSPSQDMTSSRAGESRTPPVATQDMSKLSQAQRKFVKEFLVQCNRIYQEAETEKVSFTLLSLSFFFQRY